MSESFKEEYDKHQKESTVNGDFFKFKKDGPYKFRIMAEPVKKVQRYGYGICYEGAVYCQKDAIEADYEKMKEKAKAEGKKEKDVQRPILSIKWMTWAFDYITNSFVILDMSNPIATALRELMDSDEYRFTEFPMPYDITINVKNAGTTKAKYTVQAARSNTALSAELMEEYGKLTPILQIKERLQAKQKERTEGTATQAPVEYPQGPNSDDIPF